MRRAESQRQIPGNTHMKRDKEESKKETEEGEARDEEVNMEESIFMGSKESKSLQKLFLSQKRINNIKFFTRHMEEELRLIKKRISKFN